MHESDDGGANDRSVGKVPTGRDGHWTGGWYDTRDNKGWPQGEHVPTTGWRMLMKLFTYIEEVMQGIFAFR